MWIVLAILKWIGIIIGGILGLLLFLLALILFVPVRYRIEGTNRSQTMYSFRFSWLLSIFCISKKKTSDKYWLRVFGIPVKCLAGKNKKEKRNKKQKTEEMIEKPQSNPSSEKANVKEEKKKVKKVKKTPCKKKVKKKKFFSFIRESSIIGLVKDRTNRRVIKRLMRELKLLIRYLSPTKIRGLLVLGTGDPCTTGLVFGGISLFPFVYQDGVKIVPDFEEKHFEAEGYIKGRIRVLYFVRLIHRLYQDREIKRLWKQIKTVKKEVA